MAGLLVSGSAMLSGVMPAEPDQGREKPNEGIIVTIGDLVQDKKIKTAKNKKCLFFKGAGFTVSYQGVDYLVLTSDQIIAIL